MIPLATTTVKVESLAGDPYEDKTATVVATGVRAHLSSPAGSEQLAGGSQETIDRKLDCDPVAFDKNAQITDERTGEVWQVVWVDQRQGLGLGHTVAGLIRSAGSA